MPILAQQAAANAMYAALTEALSNGTGAGHLAEHAQFVSSPRKIMELMRVGDFIAFEQKHR